MIKAIIRSLLGLIIILIASSSSPLYGQLTATVNAQISTGPNGTLVYSYTIANSPSSMSGIWLIKVDVSQPNGSVNLSSDGLLNGPGFLSNIASFVQQQTTAVVSVPVGIQAPALWFGSMGVDGTVTWGAQDADVLIAPSQTVAGFQLTTRGLPAIRSAFLQPHLDYTNLPFLSPSGPSDLNRYNQQLKAFKQTLSLQVSTIAPSAPPSNFVALTFLQNIQSYKDAAVKQGWITNAGVANSLDAKLNAALAALQVQHFTAAKNILGAFLNEVSAQSGKFLTTEAVGLLEFNVQYLLAKLP